MREYATLVSLREVGQSGGNVNSEGKAEWRLERKGRVGKPKSVSLNPELKTGTHVRRAVFLRIEGQALILASLRNRSNLMQGWRRMPDMFCAFALQMFAAAQWLKCCFGMR